jgi:hypothetical protein
MIAWACLLSLGPAGVHQTTTLSNKQAAGAGWSNSVVTDIKIR